MNYLTFTWYRSKNQLRQGEYWRDILSWGSLLGAALVLLSLNLDDSPLLAGEKLITQVAQEMGHHSLLSGQWLFPTLQGKVYHQHPPLGILLITVAHHWGGSSVLTTRLPGALLTAISVPLLYYLGREIFTARMPALFSALIYLTWFPVIRQGRLAMLDGVILFFAILTVVCLLRSRRDLRWSLGVGLSLSCLLLTQGLVGALLFGLLLIFLAWDTPRLLTCGYFWLGMSLGLIPALSWYGVQWEYYGQPFVEQMFLQPFLKSWGHFPPLWKSDPLGLVKYPWTGLIFAISGFRLAGKSVAWGWAKLILVWGGIYGMVVAVLPLAQASYSICLYPPLALAGGIALTEVYNSPRDLPYPKFWGIVLFWLSGVLSLVCLSISLNFPFDFSLVSDRFLLILTLASMAFTFGTTAVLFVRRNSQFIGILFWGMYVSLALLMSSSYWTW